MRRGSEYNQLIAYRDVRQSGEKCILTRKYMIVWGLNIKYSNKRSRNCKVP